MSTRNRSRREFLDAALRGSALAAGASLCPAGWLSPLLAAAGPGRLDDERLREILADAPLARHWISPATATTVADCRACHDAGELTGDVTEAVHEQATVRCLLCARRCRIPEGERGMCRARLNVDGELRSLVYGRPITVHVDPIEKKPFYHFLPGTAAFSLATSGCPLRCKFCQNWQISQSRPEDYDTPFTAPERIVDAARQRRTPVIAFTYNEPTVFFEYMVDIARAAREAGLRSVLISCGFMNEAPLTELCELLDAIKIDLKGANEEFYRSVCGAELAPVLRSIRQVARSDVHLELVNLVVPTLNDSETMLRELARWVVGELGPDVPVHFTRFHPDYQLRNLPPTPVATLERAREIGLEAGMHHAFVGNVPGHPGNHSYCPKCGEIVVERMGFLVTELALEKGCCRLCGQEIAGVWSSP